MKLRAHKDGTFSLTELTKRDVENLAHGMGCAESHIITNAALITNDQAYINRTASTYGRLGNALRSLAENRNRRDLVSESLSGDPTVLPYTAAVRGGDCEHCGHDYHGVNTLCDSVGCWCEANGDEVNNMSPAVVARINEVLS